MKWILHTYMLEILYHNNYNKLIIIKLYIYIIKILEPKINFELLFHIMWELDLYQWQYLKHPIFYCFKYNKYSTNFKHGTQFPSQNPYSLCLGKTCFIVEIKLNFGRYSCKGKIQDFRYFHITLYFSNINL